jgi:hypothetical protein
LHFKGDARVLADVSRKLTEEIGRARIYRYGVFRCEAPRQ